jgi:two-component system, OmpR family, heavy metal sensor histidine kinase CusS
VIRSLRSRLIVGMLLAMVVLLLAADMIIYTVQRRQLYRAFDETLLGSANSLSLLVHPGPFGEWFDSEGLSRLPAGQIREGALFQLWSDQPIDLLGPRRGPENEMGDAGLPGPPPEDDLAGQNGPSPDEAHPRNLRPPPGERPPADRQAPRPRRGPPEPRRRPEAGTLVIRSASLGELDLPRLDTAPGQPRFERIALPDGRPARAIGIQFSAPSPPPGRGRTTPRANLTAVVAASTAEIEKGLTFLAVILAATALGTMAIAGGVAWLVVSRGLRPVATVARAIAGLDANDLKQRIVEHGTPQEIEPIVHQLNGLLARLDEAFERERTLTADVAHELRTPVAELRAIAEVTLSRLRDPAEYRQALAETLETITDLQGLIEKLLVLARLEAGQVTPELRPIQLQPLLDQCWAQLARNHAGSRRVSAEIGCPPGVLVSGDPKLLEIVLSNALSNAVSYTPDGGRVTAVAEPDGTYWRISITNTGCELDEAEITRVFDRFWRADAARSAGGLSCGLGLTLVRRAMQAMGGQAEARVTAERCFVLALGFRRA